MRKNLGLRASARMRSPGRRKQEGSRAQGRPGRARPQWARCVTPGRGCSSCLAPFYVHVGPRRGFQIRSDRSETPRGNHTRTNRHAWPRAPRLQRCVCPERLGTAGSEASAPGALEGGPAASRVASAECSGCPLTSCGRSGFLEP